MGRIKNVLRSALVCSVPYEPLLGFSQVCVDGLRWALRVLFGCGRARESTRESSQDGGGSDSTAGSGGGASRWLQLKAVGALDEWVKGASEPGGCLAACDVLFADQRLPGATGGPCPVWKAWSAANATTAPPPPFPKPTLPPFLSLFLVSSAVAHAPLVGLGKMH